jgi:hypothetical protein
MVELTKIPSGKAPEMVTITREEYEKFLANDAKVAYLQLELEKLKRMIFGTKSERFAPSDPSQLSMELGQPVAAPVEPQTEQITYTRQKADKSKGDYLMADETPISVLTEDKPGASCLAERKRHPNPA